MSFSSFCEYIFNINIGGKINNINIESKNTSRQWLIPFRKYGPVSYSTKGRKEKGLPAPKSKDSRRVSASVQS